MNTIELRVMFEEDMGRKKEVLCFLRDKQGMYTNKYTRAMWSGYKAFFERMYNLGAKEMPMVGRYILGTARENGHINMSRSPYRHASKALALTEANRLAAELGKPIYLFRCHEVIQPIGDKVVLGHQIPTVVAHVMANRNVQEEVILDGA